MLNPDEIHDIVLTLFTNLDFEFLDYLDLPTTVFGQIFTEWFDPYFATSAHAIRVKMFYTRMPKLPHYNTEPDLYLLDVWIGLVVRGLFFLDSNYTFQARQLPAQLEQ
jgi:hypothetical protein